MYDVPRIIFLGRVEKRPWAFSYCNDGEEKDEKRQNEQLTQAALLHHPRQANSAESLALRSPHYGVRRLLPDLEDTTA
jgi:hypothetical protein